MSIEQVTGYRLVCDFPGCEFDTESVNGEYSSWSSRWVAVEEWEDADGYCGDEGTYCPEHTIWRDVPGEAGIEERAPMYPTLDNYVLLAERRIAERIESAERRALFNLGLLTRYIAEQQSRRFAAVDRRWGARRAFRFAVAA